MTVAKRSRKKPIPQRIKLVDGEFVPEFPDECEPHTPDPSGYFQWHAWAERMAKTHRQRQCKGCGLWAIWEPKPGASEIVHACPPDGSQATPCCGRSPFDLPHSDRITEDPAEITCGGEGTRAVTELAKPYCCPTPCDPECELNGWGCHESHVPAWKREHEPEVCEARVLAGNLRSLLEAGWRVQLSRHQAPTDPVEPFCAVLASSASTAFSCGAVGPGDALAKAADWARTVPQEPLANPAENEQRREASCNSQSGLRAR